MTSATTSGEVGGLLASRDAQPVKATNPQGRSLFLLLGDHAGNNVPQVLRRLGLPAAELHRHIAWDLGVAQLGAQLASRLDAPFIEQRYSRLVIDCNRAPTSAGSIAELSDGTAIPGNHGLDQKGRVLRYDEVFAPYHRAITAALAEREAGGRPTVLVSLHSFTPSMAGVSRPWQVGVLYGGGDARFARAMLAALQAEPDLVVGDNEPYRMDDTDYTVPAHAFAAGRPYVELEVRQDELADEAGILRVADVLGRALQLGFRSFIGIKPGGDDLANGSY
jgi:predicted N-formylglutamate amidohydrolase